MENPNQDGGHNQKEDTLAELTEQFKEDGIRALLDLEVHDAIGALVTYFFLNSLALPLSSFLHSFLSSFLMTPPGLCSCTWVFCSFGEWGIYTLVMERGL